MSVIFNHITIYHITSHHNTMCLMEAWLINMMLVLSITFYYHYKIWVVCVQLTHFSIGNSKYMSIAHVIIIKSEVSTFPIVIIFFRGCVSEMFATWYSVTYCIYIHSGKTGNLFSLLLCSVWWVHIDTFWLKDRIRSFVHYTISLSSLCKLILRHWTHKMPVRYSLSSVSVR